MIWLTADTHLGHKNIIKYCDRPFSSVKEMDETILDNINRVVKPTDTLWHLGDFSFGSQSIYRNRINCKNVHLILGNHDYKASRRTFQDLFSSVNDLFVLNAHNHRFVLCHYAMLVWPHRHHGALHCFGHSHGNVKNPEPKSMDVGVDTNNFKPYSIREVIKTLEVSNRQ